MIAFSSPLILSEQAPQEFDSLSGSDINSWYAEPAVACSRRSDSGKRCDVKRSAKK